MRRLRRDASYTLVTILLGNVAIDVLLTLLVDSVLAGVASFLFSTVVITFAGEIIPQAVFSPHALRVAALLYPLPRVYSCSSGPSPARSAASSTRPSGARAWRGCGRLSWARS